MLWCWDLRALWPFWPWIDNTKPYNVNTKLYTVMSYVVIIHWQSPIYLVAVLELWVDLLEIELHLHWNGYWIGSWYRIECSSFFLSSIRKRCVCPVLICIGIKDILLTAPPVPVKNLYNTPHTVHLKQPERLGGEKIPGLSCNLNENWPVRHRHRLVKIIFHGSLSIRFVTD